MKPFLLIVLLFINANYILQSQDNISYDTGSGPWSIKYEKNILRIPGNKFKIGIVEKKEDGREEKTRGLLSGKVKWSKFRIEVEGGSFKNGKIWIAENRDYLKDKALTVKVYDVATSNLIFIQKINYNYESQVKFLTGGKLTKVPGSIVKYGFRIIYNNGMYEDYFPPKEKFKLNIFKIDSSEIIKRNYLEKPLDKFIINSDGGYFLKRYLVIEEDPFKIKYHTARFMVSLSKNTDISDTLVTLLDYKKDYTFDSRFVRNYCLAENNDNESHERNVITFSNSYYGDKGHDLEVFVDAYKDSFFKDVLLLVSITDLTNCEHYNYLVNTSGGSIKIYSHGLDGANGSNGNSGSDGSNGMDGSDGSSGSYSTRTETNMDGTTKTVTEQGRGGDGSNGSDGGDGGNGSDGSDGGNGGNGGMIYLNYTAGAEPYLNLLDIKSIGGKGGEGGDGGRGGRGGTGGRGGNGGSGNPSGNSGSSGRNGSDGSKGRDGRDGADGQAGQVIKKLL